MTRLNRAASRASIRSTQKRFVLIASVLGAVACTADNPVVPETGSAQMPVLGQGIVTERFTGEIWVQGGVAYTTTWGNRQAPGNAIKIWDVASNVPVLVDSLIVPGAATLGDIQASDDGKLLVVATEFSPGGSIVIYDLANPLKPQLISRYSTAPTHPWGPHGGGGANSALSPPSSWWAPAAVFLGGWRSSIPPRGGPKKVPRGERETPPPPPFFGGGNNPPPRGGKGKKKYGGGGEGKGLPPPPTPRKKSPPR